MHRSDLNTCEPNTCDTTSWSDKEQRKSYVFVLADDLFMLHLEQASCTTHLAKYAIEYVCIWLVFAVKYQLATEYFNIEKSKFVLIRIRLGEAIYRKFI